MLNYYNVLGIEDFSSAEDVKRAYRNMVRKYHPDTTMFDKSFAEGKIREVNEAYSVLGNDDKKTQYDNQLKDYYAQLNNQRFKQANQYEERKKETGIFCPNCGKKNSASSNFCCYCGLNLTTYTEKKESKYTDVNNEEHNHFEEENTATTNENDENIDNDNKNEENNHGCLWMFIFVCLLIGGVMFAGGKSENNTRQMNLKNGSTILNSESASQHDVDYDQAETLYKNKDYNLAISFYTKAINKGFKTLDSYKKRAECYNYIEDYRHAEKDYNFLIAAGEVSSRTLLGRGFARLMLEDTSSAIIDFKCILDNCTDDSARASAYLGLGLAYERVKEFKHALYYYKMAKDIFPNYETYQNAITRVKKKIEGI